MDSATEDIYLQKLGEYIYDEDKIVTYTWLSSNLEIKVTDARHLLEKFIKDARHLKPDDLGVTFVLLGETNGKGFNVTLAKENELSEKRAQFKRVASEHVYSVQKCKDTDVSALSLVEPFSVNDVREKPLLGSIVSKNCVKRNFKIKKIIPQEKPVQKTKTSFFVKTVKTDESADDVTRDKTETVTKKNKQNQKEIGTFFQKAPDNGNNDAKHKSVQKKTKPHQSNLMANFLSKSPNGPKTNGKEERIVTESDSQSSNGLEMNNVHEPVVVIEEDEPVAKKKKIETPKHNKKSKRNRTDNNSEQPQKKRKKIIVRNDSDSDDIFGDADEETNEDQVIDVSDEEVHKPTKPELPVKNKKRKLVTRSYADEEGYMLTKKEWVYESGSETGDEEKEQKPQNELETKEKKTNSEINEKRVSSPKANKKKGMKVSHNQQMMMMNFFKK